VPPFAVTTTGMPSPVVCAPVPAVFAIFRPVVPVALPPSTTTRSVGDASAPRNVFSAIVPPLPT